MHRFRQLLVLPLLLCTSTCVWIHSTQYQVRGADTATLLASLSQYAEAQGLSDETDRSSVAGILRSFRGDETVLDVWDADSLIVIDLYAYNQGRRRFDELNAPLKDLLSAPSMGNVRIEEDYGQRLYAGYIEEPMLPVLHPDTGTVFPVRVGYYFTRVGIHASPGDSSSMSARYRATLSPGEIEVELTIRPAEYSAEPLSLDQALAPLRVVARALRTETDSILSAEDGAVLAHEEEVILGQPGFYHAGRMAEFNYPPGGLGIESGAKVYLYVFSDDNADWIVTYRFRHAATVAGKSTTISFLRLFKWSLGGPQHAREPDTGDRRTPDPVRSG